MLTANRLGPAQKVKTIPHIGRHGNRLVRVALRFALANPIQRKGQVRAALFQGSSNSMCLDCTC